jgi:hypothetical protein
MAGGYATNETARRSKIVTGYGNDWIDDDDGTYAAWNCWVTAASTACTNYTLDTCSTDGAWNNWVITSNSATSSSNTVVWNAWANQAQMALRDAARSVNQWRDERRAPAPPETAEQRMAREARQVKERAEAEVRAKAYAEKAAKEELERQKAKKRARRLLTSNLTKEQVASLEKFGFFEVMVEGKTYRIRQGTHGNVRLLGSDGKESKSFCIQPNGVPDEDAMLAQKLMLETDEASFLKIANARDLRN